MRIVRPVVHVVKIMLVDMAILVALGAVLLLASAGLQLLTGGAP